MAVSQHTKDLNHKRYQHNIALGLCTQCHTTQTTNGNKRCTDCINKSKIYKKQLRKERSDNNWCVDCGYKDGLKTRYYCDECAGWYRLNVKRKRLERKIKVLKAYGGLKCSCQGCSVVNLVSMLTLDHIDNNGSTHRAEVIGENGGATQFYAWIIKNNFPPGFQVLCFNCNESKHINGGTCQHMIGAINE